jgi:hypothetical protein
VVKTREFQPSHLSAVSTDTALTASRGWRTARLLSTGMEFSRPSS